MKSYMLNVECPICGNKFKASVLTDFSVKGYTYDFMPIFDDGPELLNYYIWFCDKCHFSGYDNRFNYEKNKVSYGDEFIKKYNSLEKDKKITLAYKFFRAGDIAKLLNEKPISLIDYYTKSYWSAKIEKNDNYIEKSFFEVLSVADEIIRTCSDPEALFLAYYISGYLNYEAGEFEQAAYFFSKLLNLKIIMPKYERYLKFASDFIKGYK